MNKIGVFGGTFDPVHNGHIWLARQAADELALDQVVVVPAKNQPFKLDRRVTSGEHRFKMLELAFADCGVISVSDIELKKDAVSYTIDTLKEIRGMYGRAAEIFFILGADAFRKIEKWKDAEELLSDYSFAVGTRPGFEETGLNGFFSSIRGKYGTKIFTVNNTLIEISSTEIKDMIKTGERLSAVPEDVERYIIENGLYQGLY